MAYFLKKEGHGFKWSDHEFEHLDNDNNCKRKNHYGKLMRVSYYESKDNAINELKKLVSELFMNDSISLDEHEEYMDSDGCSFNYDGYQYSIEPFKTK